MNLEDVEPPSIKCRYKCSSIESCAHGENALVTTYLEQYFEGPLALLNIHSAWLKPATSIPGEVDSLFRRSRHPFFQPDVIFKMPPSTDWVFSPGEVVNIMNPTADSSFDDVIANVYGIRPGVEGVIKTVEDSHCEVAIPRVNGAIVVQEDFRISKSCI